MSDYTYPLGLLITGLVVFAFGMIAARRERRARRPVEQLSLPISGPSHTSHPPAHAQ